MHIIRKSIVCMLALLVLLSGSALAAEEILAKNLENAYSVDTGSDTLAIDIEQWHYAYKKHDLRFFVAHVKVADPSQMQTAFAGEKYSRDNAEATSAIAARHDAVIAINGDYYNFKESNGVVIRNGVLYREDDNLKRDVCVLYWDGTMKTFAPGEFDTAAEMARGAYQAWNFGPYLLGENGEALEDFNSSVKPQNPRTAIGYYEPGHYAIVVIDGRSYKSIGMSMKNLSKLMEGLGCKVAYNLDGGESSEMVWGTERISVPYKNGRQNSDAVMIIDGE